MVHKKPDLISRRKFIGSVMLASTGAALISSCQRSRYEIGCFTRPWAKYEYRVAFDGIAGAGYEYAGLMSSDRGLIITADTAPDEAYQVGEEARKRNLKIASLYGNVDVRNSLEDGISGLTRLINNAGDAGCRNIVFGGTTNIELENNYYKAIAECCDLAAERGVSLSLKPHGGSNTTGPQCKALVERVGHQNFSVWYDPGNIYWYTHAELDPVDDSREVDGVVTGMCVKDYSHEPRDVNLTPGTGMVDFETVFANLRQGGFTRGPLVVECLSMGELDYVNNEAKKARQFLLDLTS